MPFTSMTKPAVGTPTSKSQADTLIDNDAYLLAEIQKLKAVEVPNGSFEIDTDSDGYPDRWTFSAISSGTGALDSTDQIHGLKSFKFTSTGAGGGTLTSESFFEVSPNVPVILRWEQKSSTATVQNKVELLWYDSAQSSISASTLLDSTSNPTAWTLQSGSASAPSTARYAKIKITGIANSVSGNVKFDNVSFVGTNTPGMEVLTSSGTWTCPNYVNNIRIRAWGGGGGGGSGATAVIRGGGGGSGEYVESIVAVTPGTGYSYTIGAGGSAGSAGTDSTFNSTTVVAKGGSAGGNSSGGSGAAGAGGTGGTGTFKITGGYGQVGSISADFGGGGGGSAPMGGGGGNGSLGTTGVNGLVPGGGGSGGATSTAGAGAAGRIIIEYL